MTEREPDRRRAYDDIPTVDDLLPPEGAESLESSGRLDPVETLDHTEPLDAPEPPEPTDYHQPLEPVDYHQPLEPVDYYSGPLEPLDAPEPLDALEPLEPLDALEPPEPLDALEPLESLVHPVAQETPDGWETLEQWEPLESNGQTDRWDPPESFESPPVEEEADQKAAGRPLEAPGVNQFHHHPTPEPTELPTVNDESTPWAVGDDVSDGGGSATAQRADIDARGSWIPPALRGIADDAEEAGQKLPRRR